MKHNIPPLWLEIFAIQSATYQCDAMRDFVQSICASRGYTTRTDLTGNLYVTKGVADLYPVAVAHLDTVHSIIQDGALTPLVSPDGNWITGFNWTACEQSGIGGDDKCGIIAALACLDALPACKAFFPVDEETGCEGSSMADPAFFADAAFLMQADRKGCTDFVTHIMGDAISSTAFIKAASPLMKLHNYKTCKNGGITDVGQLVSDKACNVSAVNLSAAYYRPHDDRECVNVPDLHNVIALMIAMGQQMGDTKWSFTPKSRRRRWESFSNVKEAPKTSAGFLDPIPEGTDVEAEIQALIDKGNIEGAYDLAEYYGLRVPKWSDSAYDESSWNHK